MKILIVGGSGLLGKYISEELSNHDPYILDINDMGNSNTIIGNILDLDFLIKLFTRFECIIHIAALTSNISCVDGDIFKTNLLGTFNVHEAARIAGIEKVISTSSEAVYGYFGADVHIDLAPNNLPITEDHPPNPKSAYALSKYQGEEVARFFSNRYKMITPVIRPSWIVAPIDYEIHQGFINGGSCGGERNQSAFRYDCFNTHAWIDVRDLANAYKYVLYHSHYHDIYNVCSNDSTLNMPLSMICKYKEIYSEFTDRRSGLSNAKIKSLGFNPLLDRSLFL